MAKTEDKFADRFDFEKVNQVFATVPFSMVGQIAYMNGALMQWLRDQGYLDYDINISEVLGRYGKENIKYASRLKSES